MGRVYLARDGHLDRLVAVKVLATERAGGAARLRREAAITARLDHPGIVPVLDAGDDADGRPYYVMRLIRGRSLWEALAEADTPERRLALLRHFLDAAEAVAYAHSLGVVHRDLKPDNVMVGAFGETQVVDWGLARLAGEDDAPVGGSGTPGYASPEQARGEPADQRSDVWSLGAVLHALLTGHPPDGRRPDGPPELVAIVARATASEPSARYPDARALAADVARYFEGRRVEAHDYTPLELLARLVRAWRAPLVVAGVAAVLLAGVGVAGWRRTQEARALADRRLAAALVQQAAQAARDGDRARAEVLAAHALALGPSPRALGVLARYTEDDRPTLLATHPLPACRVLRADGERLLCMTETSTTLLDATGAPVWTVDVGAADGAPLLDGGAVLASGEAVSVVGADGRVTASVPPVLGLRGVRAFAGAAIVWSWIEVFTIDLATGAVSVRPTCPVPARASALAHRDHDLIVACDDGTLWSLGPGEAAPLPPFEVAISALAAFGEDLVVATPTGALVRRRADGTIDGPDETGVGFPGALVPLEEAVVVAGIRGAAHVWDPDTRALGSIPADRAPLARTPSGDLWARTGDTLEVWRVPAPVAGRFGGTGGVTSVAASPDGAVVAATRGAGWLTVYDLRSGHAVATVQWQDALTKSGDFSPDGRTYAASGMGKPATALFDARDWRVLREDLVPYRRVAGLADGSFVGLSWGPAIAWRGDDRVELPGLSAFDASRTPAGDRVAILDDEGRVRIVEPGSSEPREVARVPEAQAVALAPDGERLALLVGGAVRLGARTLDPPSQPVDLAFSPDGAWLAAGLLDGGAALWRVADGALVAVFEGHAERVASVAFTPDSRTLLTGSWDGDLRRWHLERLAGDDAARLERAWSLDLRAALE